MTILEYDTKFTQLSHYALHLVETEQMRIAHFIRRLADPYFIAMSPQIAKLTYTEAVNATLEIESGKADRKAVRKATKKVKNRGSYLGHSSLRVTSSDSSPVSAPALGSQVRSTFQSNLHSSKHSTPSPSLC